MVTRPWSSSRLSCGECLHFRCDGNAGNSLPTTQGKDASLELGVGNRAPLDVGGTLVLPLEWRQYFGKILELQPGCEERFGSSRG